MVYMHHHIESELQISLHLAIMEPFFVHAQNQRYALDVRKDCEDHEKEISRAIRLATEGSHVSVTFATPSRPGVTGFWPGRAWRRRLSMLTTDPGAMFAMETLRAWHGHEGFGEFNTVINDTLWEQSLDESISFPSRELTMRCRHIVNSAIRLYLTYAIHGSVVGTNRLAHLMACLPTTIPLGDIEEWPGTCLMLAT
ncbi:hypothetical protein ACFLZO_00725 [Patescibacteria group bacterium]